MLKVFLTEDEFIIRNAIKRTIQWEKEGYELVGEAGDGERAYPMIMEQKPDIVITDIRMPFMDGLELSRLIRKSLPNTKIMILSGYDDFSYAKEAISLGVAEYLLKPVSGEQLLEALNRLKSQIEQEQNRVDYKEIYEEEHQERLKLEKTKFIKKIINGAYSMSEAVERGEQLGIDLMACNYAVMQLQFAVGDEKTVDQTVEQDLTALKEQMIQFLEQMEHVEVYEQIGEICCVLMIGKSEHSLDEQRTEILEWIKTKTAAYPQLHYFVSLGKNVMRLSEIHDSFVSAAKLFSHRFLYSESHIFSENDTDMTMQHAQRSQRQADSIDLSSFNISFIDRTFLRSFIRSGTEEEIPEFLKEILENMGANNLSSRILRQYLAVDVYLTLAAYLQTNGMSAEDVQQQISSPSVLMEDSLSSMESYLSDILTKVIQMRNAVSESKYSAVIQEANRYIETHYADNSISLSSVAEDVGISTNHFSRIYSQETGQTFVEALTETRMKKAKELLLTTDLPGSEIGLQVGYNDPHYFYYTFKKTQNMTPKEYRACGGRSV